MARDSGLKEIPLTARERVEVGARMLDQVEPGWFKKIDLKTFDISSGSRCVLGQVHGGFNAGLERLVKQGINGYRNPDTIIWEAEDVISFSYGFNADHVVGYKELQAQWLDAISERLTEAGM